MTAGQKELVALTGADGQFEFTGLAPAIYLLDADLPGWRFDGYSERDLKVDLTKANCVRLYLFMEELQGEIRGTQPPTAEERKKGQ